MDDFFVLPDVVTHTYVSHKFGEYSAIGRMQNVVYR